MTWIFHTGKEKEEQEESQHFEGLENLLIDYFSNIFI